MFTLQDILEHAAQPAACYKRHVPTMAMAADDEGFVKICDAGYEQETVYLVSLTEAGREELDRMTQKWEPWIEWTGQRFIPDLGPDGAERIVEIKHRSPDSACFIITEAHHVEWQHTGGDDDVVAYRVEKMGTL